MRNWRGKAGLFLGMMLVMAPCAEAQQASLILRHGKIWTEEATQPEASAVAIDGNRILAVGDDATIAKLAGPATRIVDLEGRRLLPGFNDAHVHFLDGGATLISVPLTDCDSPAEFRRRIGAFAKTLPKGAWILNGNWDHQRWTPAELPTHSLIDDVTPDNPAMLWRIDGHMILVNALAMKLAGIDRTTKDVPGGEILRDKQGNPTGILKDAATALVSRVLPPPTPAEVDKALTAALAEAASHGVTSVQNLSESPSDTSEPAMFRVFQRWERAGKLTVRIYTGGRIADWKSLADVGIEAPFGSPRLRLGSVKSFADGALGSETAWMEAPFSDKPGYRGLANSDLLDENWLFAAFVGADQAGLQLATHAIGDHANRVILDLYERLIRQDGPRDRRLRIEHAQHLRPEDIPRFAQLGVIASMQPYHAIDDGRWAERPLGPERIKTSYAWRSLLDGGAVLAFGSDWPVAPLDPLLGIYAATTRRTFDGKNPNGWIPDQRITVAEAVHAYTLAAAYAEHQETIKGSIKPGKLADLVVLSDDIFAIKPEAIEKTHVTMTIFDGTILYEKN